MLGRYRLIAEIGRGGMARVYLALSQGLPGIQHTMVVKELLPEIASDPRIVQMFLAEAKLSARLRHPNIVQTIEVGQDGDRYFIVMEYLDGQSLQSVVARARGAEAPIALHLHLFVLSEVLNALHYLHDLQSYSGKPLNIVHRDVTPHNVFVTYDGQTRLMDFGVAQTSDAVRPTTDSIVGKAHYMAPEQAAGDALDRRADVFSAGVMLWEAVTGRGLWAGVPVDDVTKALLRGAPIPSVRSVVPNVPEALEIICHRALAIAPRDRYPNCLTFQQELDAFAATLPRSGPKQVGRYMGELFSSTRERANAAIRARLHEFENSQQPAPDTQAILRARQATPAPAQPRTARPAAPTHATAEGAATAEPARTLDALGSVAAILATLNDVPGVLGSVAYGPDGEVLVTSLPTDCVAHAHRVGQYLRACRQAMATIGAQAATRHTYFFDLQTRQVLVRQADVGSILVLTAQAPSSQTVATTLNVSLNAAVLKLADAFTPRPVRREVKAVTGPAERDRATDSKVLAESGLKALTACLAQRLGPLAGVLVRRAMTDLGVSGATIQTKDIERLIAKVATSIEDTDDREDFTKQARRAAQT